MEVLAEEVDKTWVRNISNQHDMIITWEFLVICACPLGLRAHTYDYFYKESWDFIQRVDDIDGNEYLTVNLSKTAAITDDGHCSQHEVYL